MQLKYFRLFLFITGSFLVNSLVLAQLTHTESEIKQFVNNIAAPLISGNKIPGAAIAIYYKDQDYYFNYGIADRKKNTPMTKDTVFELASLTKIFVTTLLALEVQAGKMKLSDPAVQYIPQLAQTSGLAIDRVQIVNLATHTASFPRQMEQFGVGKGDINGLFNQLKTWKPQVRIGTQYKYSNVSFGFLGAVLEGATEDTLPDLLNKKISSPLGMNNTYFSVPQNKAIYEAQGYRPNNMPAPYYTPANFLGGGALRSSAADLLKFMKANLGVNEANSSPQLLAAMQFAQQPYFFVKPKFVMGLGWERVRRGQGLLITKNGKNQGFNTFIGFSPSQKLGVVVLTNQSTGQATLLGHQILKNLLAR